jgi:hypothetical protein
MNDLNYQFFEEFTKLDKTCVSVYQAEGGTLGYLEQMGSVSGFGAELIPNWIDNLELLHRYRTIYLALSQSPDAFEECLCTQEDVRWLQDFRSRIMERKDPLALLQMKGYRAGDDAVKRLESERTGEIVLRAMNPRDRYVNGPIVVGIILVAVIMTCVLCMLMLKYLGTK